jgi:hypothetical protein
MKKLFVAGAVILVVILMAVFLVVPVFAQGPENTSNPFQACLNGLNGDYQSMLDYCRKFVGTNNMPCLNPGGNVSNPSQPSPCH